MAQLHLQPPDPFNFKAPDEWPRWRRRFEQFRVASGLAEDSPAKQVSTLLYCLGEEAESILLSTNATEEDRRSYAAVLDKFDAFFRVRRNVIFERARFNRRNQQPGETAEQYIMTLYSLAANCEYGALEEEMIRDRLVVGIRDTSLSERLQIDADLTLEKAKKAIRQREAVQEHQQVLKGAEDPSLEAVHSSGDRSKRRDQRRGNRGSNSGAADRGKHRQKSKQCTRCGKEQHARDKCPAKDATCHRCQKKGHYSALCFAKNVSTLSTEPYTSDLDTAFLDSASSGQGTAWFADVQMGESDSISFKLDTGAEVTALSHSTYQQLSNPPQLNAPDKALYGPSRRPLQVLGQCQSDLTYNGRSCRQQLFVVEGLQNNLLGLPAITALNLITLLEETTAPSSSAHIPDRFLKVFQGLGNLGDQYDIKLKPDATPFSLFTPRHVPLPLRAKVTEELQRMEAMGVISKVDIPTPWCAGMVVVPKKSGSVRICVDLKPLNQSVLREVHPIPKVDDTLAMLTGAKVFSKLDANSGFW